MIVTEKEAAHILSLSLQSMQRLRREYDLPVLKLGRKRWFDVHELQDAMKGIKDKPEPMA